MNAKQAESEFSRPFAVDEMGADEVRVELEARAEERAALARRLDLLALDRLTAVARIKRSGAGGAFGVHVNFVADVVQSCVVTLDPIPVHIEESVDLVYAPEHEIPVERVEVVLSQEGEDRPEPLREGAIDLGEAVAEHLALALDPYPRRPGVSLDDVRRAGGPESGAEDEGPLAMLRRWKEKA